MHSVTYLTELDPPNDKTCTFEGQVQETEYGVRFKDGNFLVLIPWCRVVGVRIDGSDL